MNGSNSFTRAAIALRPMLTKNALNPADITVLYKLYNSPTDPPVVDLLRIPQLLGTWIKSYPAFRMVLITNLIF